MRKSTLSHTTVFLLQVMRFAKLNKPPLSFKPPLSVKPLPSKVLEKNKPPGGLNRGFTVLKVKNTQLIVQAHECLSYPS